MTLMAKIHYDLSTMITIKIRDNFISLKHWLERIMAHLSEPNSSISRVFVFFFYMTLDKKQNYTKSTHALR